MTNMKWSFVDASMDPSGDPNWILVDDGDSKAAISCTFDLVKRIVEGLNLLDASSDKGLIGAMQDMKFDIVFTPTPKPARVRR